MWESWWRKRLGDKLWVVFNNAKNAIKSHTYLITETTITWSSIIEHNFLTMASQIASANSIMRHMHWTNNTAPIHYMSCDDAVLSNVVTAIQWLAFMAKWAGLQGYFKMPYQPLATIICYKSYKDKKEIYSKVYVEIWMLRVM